MKELEKPTSVRIPKETKDKLKKIAKEEGRSLGNLIMKIILDFLKKRKTN